MAAASGSRPSVAATNYNPAPCQEYFLQGSIRVEHLDTLLEILHGLCDGSEEPIHEFRDHETYYDVETTDKAKRRWIQLRVSRSLLHADAPPRVRYVGRSERGMPSQPTGVRTNINVGVTGDIDEFLSLSGFKQTFEYVAEGYVFRKGRMKITLSRIMENVGSRATPDYRNVTDSYLVEMSVIERPNATAAGVEMRRFADNLKPLVDMIKPE